jgi:hypothetical protein
MSEQSTDPRRGLMAALSAAERIVALSPVPPAALRVQQHSALPADTFGVELHYAAPEAVRGIATSLGVETVTDRFWFGESLYVETAAVGYLDGVAVRAWTQTLATRAEIEAHDRAAALLVQRHDIEDPAAPPLAVAVPAEPIAVRTLAQAQGGAA